MTAPTDPRRLQLVEFAAKAWNMDGDDAVTTAAGIAGTAATDDFAVQFDDLIHATATMDGLEAGSVDPLQTLGEDWRGPDARQAAWLYWQGQQNEALDHMLGGAS